MSWKAKELWFDPWQENYTILLTMASRPGLEAGVITQTL
jgi:hypothetical protein